MAKNPQDSTLRNVRSAAKKIEKLQEQVRKQKLTITQLGYFTRSLAKSLGNLWEVSRKLEARIKDKR